MININKTKTLFYPAFFCLLIEQNNKIAFSDTTHLSAENPIKLPLPPFDQTSNQNNISSPLRKVNYYKIRPQRAFKQTITIYQKSQDTKLSYSLAAHSNYIYFKCLEPKTLHNNIVLDWKRSSFRIHNK